MVKALANPWHDLPAEPPFVLPCDREAVDEYQRRVRHEAHRLVLERLPEPWVGDPWTATVLVLQLNPGYNPARDDHVHARTDYQEVVRSSLTRRRLDTPFYFLDPRFADSGGHDWCRQRNHWAIRRVGVEVVSKQLAQVEWFPYRSPRGGRLPKLPSQRYSIELVRRAIERNAVMIATRKIDEWEAAVPELVGYPRRLGTASWQNVALSPGNLTIGGTKTTDAFELYVQALSNGATSA